MDLIFDFCRRDVPFTFPRFLQMAAHVFGSRDAAEAWMLKPAIFLDRERPIDLMMSPDGANKVRTYLGQIYFCVGC